MIQKNKAVIVFGGPGSGKDLLIRSTMLGEEAILEVDLNQLHRAILDAKDVVEVNSGTPLLVNGNGDDFSKLDLTKRVLESMGYDVLGLYVYTSDAVSRARNEQRIKSGAKTIAEAVRAAKWERSLANAKTLSKAFDPLLVFDNSSSVLIEDVTDQIKAINDALTEHFCTDIDQKVSEFLEEAYDLPSRGDRGERIRTEFGANQKLSQTTKQKPKADTGGSDYFSYNAKKHPSSNQSQPTKRPAATTSTGPGDRTSTGPKGRVNESLPSFKTFQLQRLSSIKQPLKPPKKIDTIRPWDSVGGGFGSQGQNGSPSLAMGHIGEEKKITKKAAKPPSTNADARQGDDMAGVETIGEAKAKPTPVKGNKPCPPSRGDSRVTPVDGETQVLSMNAEQRILGKLGRTAVEVYEDWGVAGEMAFFEGRCIKTNKPFKNGKKFAVYVKDGDNVTRLSFSRKGAIALNENLKPTDVQFWETK